MLSRRTILLKPMQPAVSGFARLQTDDGRTLVQLHARGLEPGEKVRLYWYLSGQHAQEIAQAAVNAHGEVSAEHEDNAPPERLLALILISSGDAPKPLLIGLCRDQSGAGLLDAKNAALALCERLDASRRPAVRPVLAPEPKAVPQAESEPLPREVFLPAIDPAPYAQAVWAEQEEPEAILPPPKRNAPPVDRLKPLRWPAGFESLRPYFENALPTALFDLPGWRFVYAAHAGGPNGLWIGMHQQDGRVRGVAYAHRGDRPPAAGKGYRAMRGLDGLMYQVLVQKV